MSLEDSSDPVQRWRPLPLPSGLAPADLHAQVRRRLSMLDSIEKEIAVERSCLNVVWNRTLPFNRLPHELLVIIFALVADNLSVKGSLNLLTQHHPSVKRTTLILVCRHWHDVIHASPQLWRVIHVRSSVYTERALSFSTPATIDVFFNDRLAESRNLKLLRPHTDRLRSLHFHMMEKGWKVATVALFHGARDMPTLENLDLPFHWGRSRDPRDEQFVDLQLTPERFPRLQSLAVSLVVAPENIGVYARLCKLSLDTCRCDFSFEHFLDALGAASNLESLELDSTLQRIQGDWVERIVTSRGPLPLCHLKSLALVNHPPTYTSRFLSYILLSPTASARIHSDLGNISEMDVTETIPAILPPDPAAVLPALALVKEAVISALDREYSLSCSMEPHKPGPSHALPLITLQVWSSEISDWHHFSNRVMRDLLRVFASAPLTTLDFSGDCCDVAIDTWMEVFSKYALLETLRLGVESPVEPAFAGLMDAPAPPDSPVPCPRLRSVSVVGPFFEPSVDVMLQCLRDRADKDYRLEDISMDLEGSDEDRTLMESHYIPELEHLVSQVAWTFTINESISSLEFWV